MAFPSSPTNSQTATVGGITYTYASSTNSWTRVASSLGNIVTVNLDGNGSNILYGNGTFSSAPVSYSNSNVAAYLPTYTGNISAANIYANGTINFTTASNVSLGSNANIKITGGTTGQVLSTDGAGNLSWTTSAGGPGGSPGGSNTYVQFNDGSTFGGDAGLTFNKVTDTLTTGNLIATSQVQAGSGTGGNITGANVVSSNTFITTSQGTLPTAIAGQIDYDGSAMYATDNTTSGRGVLQPVQMYRYTSAGAATATTITDYFPSTSSLNLQANAIYEIDAHCYFLKNTAGTATWTWAFSTGVNFARSYYVSSIITGFTTTTVVGAPVTGMAVVQGGAATTLVHTATGSLTAAVYHSFHFKLFLVTNTACNVRLRVTNSAGTITPQVGSFYTVRKLGAQAGIFTA